jgi:hypothetical protein
MKRIRVGLVALVFGLYAAAAAHGAWVVNEEGECVREWTPASLGRGPAAMLNAPLLPFRSAAGGVQLAASDRTPKPGLPRRILLPPLLAVAGGGMGLVESGIWLGTGLVDTLSGGYLEVAPDEATHLGVGPVTPAFTDARPKAEPRCAPSPRADAR